MQTTGNFVLKTVTIRKTGFSKEEYVELFIFIQPMHGERLNELSRPVTSWKEMAARLTAVRLAVLLLVCFATIYITNAVSFLAIAISAGL